MSYICRFILNAFSPIYAPEKEKKNPLVFYQHTFQIV